MSASLVVRATPRLLLRRWREDDLAPFAAMNADAEVMRFYPTILTRQESDALAARIQSVFEQHGFGMWAVEIPGVAEFAGFVGLSVPNFEAHFMPCVEIGWRIAAPLWRRGYATEGAAAALDMAFGELGLTDVVAFTVPHNAPSRRVMEKLGMTRDLTEDFDHPRLAEGHPLRRHVLYRMGRDAWLRRRRTGGRDSSGRCRGDALEVMEHRLHGLSPSWTHLERKKCEEILRTF